jgi:nicotinic acid mononucleotide adenylyltransferase
MTKYGFFSITGDPIHLGHIAGAENAARQLELDAVYLQVCGDGEYKPNKVEKFHRHKMVQLAIAENHPLLRYTPLGYEKNAFGEDLFVDFVHEPAFSDVEKFYYLAGLGNRAVVLESFRKNEEKLIGINYSVAFLSAKKDYSPESDPELYPVVYYEPFYASTDFRSHKRPDIVPGVVLVYCKEHHLYGY